MPEKTKSISVRMPETLVDNIDQHAWLCKSDRTTVVIVACEEYLQRAGKGIEFIQEPCASYVTKEEYDQKIEELEKQLQKMVDFFLFVRENPDILDLIKSNIKELKPNGEV